MTVRRIFRVSFVLACALGATACGNSESAAKAVAETASVMPKQDFDGAIVDYKCFQSSCDHAHYSVGDSIRVSPKAGGQYHFKSRKKDGEINESELSYSNGFLRGTTEFEHHGSREKHWLILVPYEKEPWAIVVCDKDPGEAESCDGDQHSGYGHADD